MYCEAYWNIHFSRQNCDGLSETPMHAITQPSFAHHVGQSAVLSYHIGALYGELLLHSSCMPFHAKSISFERLWSLNQYNLWSYLHTIPLSPFINVILQHRAVHLFASRDHDRLGLICIVMVPSRFCWNHSFQIDTSRRSINHRSSFTIPPSRLTYCPVFIVLLPSTTGTRSASFS